MSPVLRRSKSTEEGVCLRSTSSAGRGGGQKQRLTHDPVSFYCIAGTMLSGHCREQTRKPDPAPLVELGEMKKMQWEHSTGVATLHWERWEASHRRQHVSWILKDE